MNITCNRAHVSRAREISPPRRRRPDWMSLTNMDSCLAQPDTIVIREGKQIHPETIMTNEELDIMEETYADIPPMNWRNYGTWFGGAMVKPTTSESLEYCVENGTYFDAPNAYFIEGWEDGDCEATVIGTGKVPPLGDLPQYTLTEIWDEMFTNPNVTEIPQATFKPRPKRITPEEVLAICDRAETASAEEVKAAYYVLMINAPCWAFSENENEQRAFLIGTREGPQS